MVKLKHSLQSMQFTAQAPNNFTAA